MSKIKFVSLFDEIVSIPASGIVVFLLNRRFVMRNLIRFHPGERDCVSDVTPRFHPRPRGCAAGRWAAALVPASGIMVFLLVAIKGPGRYVVTIDDGFHPGERDYGVATATLCGGT